MAAKILVVDDEPKLVQNLKAYLEQASYAVVTASDGRQALEVFRRERPALVVLDLRLPEMHGMDVAREIRKESNVPIVMLTAQLDDLDKIAGLEAGADDYITKPFNPRELVARVRAVLRRTEDQQVRPSVKVFISSVMLDYEPERRVVRDAIYMLQGAGLSVRPVAAEQFPAGPDPPRQALLKEVDESDMYVGIIGRRYGYINPLSGLSASEEEYRRARETGKPILIFIEQLPAGQTREPLQEAFVSRLQDYSAGHYVGFFANHDQLRFEAYRSLERLLNGFPRREAR